MMSLRHQRRIGVDFHGWSGIFQGTRSHLFGIYSEAVRLAPDLLFVFLAEHPEQLKKQWAAARLPNVEIRDLPKRHGLLRLFVQLPLAILRHNLDVLHVQYRIPPLFTSRMAVTIHDILFERYPEFFPPNFTRQSKILFRFASRFAGQVLTVSEYSRREIAVLYGHDEKNIVVTYNGVDLRRFSPTPQAHDADVLRHYGLDRKRYVLTVGRLEPRKNQAQLVRAFRTLGRNDLTLVLIGQRDFAFNEALGEIEKARGEGFRILLLEDVADTALPTLMREAAVFAYLAFAEGFGMPPLEAMASGVPVIVSNTTAMPEVIGEAGILVSPFSEVDVTLALRRMLDDSELRARLATRGLSRAREFTWEQSALNLVQAFRRMTGTRDVEAIR